MAKSVETGNDESGKETVDVTEEIELGTAKFETLFESIVDKCFDKFELYVLRNLFVVPPDLIEGGWIRLAHHNGIDFRPESQPDHLNTNNQPDRSNAKKSHTNLWKARTDWTSLMPKFFRYTNKYNSTKRYKCYSNVSTHASRR